MFSRSYGMLFLSSLLLFVLPGCWQTVEKKEEKKSLYVINVLSKKLYDECHITGSISVPFTQVMNWAKSIDKKAEVVLYCADYACTASAFEAKQLIDNGFEHVWEYGAGMHDWYANDFPSTCEVKSTYLSKENKSPEDDESSVPVLSTKELYEKMIKHGILILE